MAVHTTMLNSLLEGQKITQGEPLLSKSKLTQNQTNITVISSHCGQLETSAQYFDNDIKELRDDLHELKWRCDVDHAIISIKTPDRLPTRKKQITQSEDYQS